MKRLAIVADQSWMIDAYRLVVRQSMCFRIVAVIDGRRPASAPLRHAQPDVVLIDEMRDPVNTSARIREAGEELPDAKILLLASAMDRRRVADALNAGADAVLSKEIHPVALITLMRETANGNIFHSTAGLKLGREEGPGPALTAREFEILHMVAEGCTNAQIARELWVTEKTVKFHLSNVYRKLGVTNRTEASHYAHTNELLERRSRRRAA
jgi:DNA-binding NarL/FixJ family response regulator